MFCFCFVYIEKDMMLESSGVAEASSAHELNEINGIELDNDGKIHVC
jgi:hypothetical protein